MQLRTFLLTLFAAFLVAMSSFSQTETRFGATDFEVEIPNFFIDGIESSGALICTDLQKLESRGNLVSVVVNGNRETLEFKNGRAEIHMVFDRPEPLSIKAEGFAFVREIDPIPLWMSIIPPLLVIGLALITKEVISSLLFGVFIGAGITGHYGFEGSFLSGFFRIIDTYVVQALADPDHAAVILFSVMIGGVVAVVSKNGGMKGVVEVVSRKATDAKKGQFATWFLGIAIFFDDYANTLVVGNTMRPLTDRLKISREKLSYIVDSTAAPVAAIALITTWIGAELGYIDDALDTIRTSGSEVAQSSYAIFLGSLEYAYYPIFCLGFIFFLIWKNKDFGPMYKAEKAARLGNGSKQSTETGAVDLSEFEPEPGTKPNPWWAIIPISIIVLGTVFGLLYTGWDQAVWDDTSTGIGKKLSMTIGNSDSYVALLWASLSGLFSAVVVSLASKTLSLSQSIESAIDGFKSMVGAMAILILAWSLAAVTDDLHTADFLAGLVAGNVAHWLIPGLTFLISAIVAFSTGSSWGTMAIVYPLMLPLAWEIGLQVDLESGALMGLFLNVTSCVLSGAVLGDHCSPISDTTILSSLATKCDHIAHVRTQLPYALTVGVVALVFTTLSGLFNLPWFIGIPSGLAILFGVVHFLGKEVPLADE